jgi:lipid-binding SYLF domain-containing protein
VFAGINLSGGALKVDADSNTDAYGKGAALEALLNGTGPTLQGANAFLNALGPSPAATTGTTKPAPTAK